MGKNGKLGLQPQVSMFDKLLHSRRLNRIKFSKLKCIKFSKNAYKSFSQGNQLQNFKQLCWNWHCIIAYLTKFLFYEFFHSFFHIFTATGQKVKEHFYWDHKIHKAYFWGKLYRNLWRAPVSDAGSLIIPGNLYIVLFIPW